MWSSSGLGGAAEECPRRRPVFGLCSLSLPTVVLQAVVGMASWVCHGVSEGSAFSAPLKTMLLTNKPPKAKDVETDAHHGTPTMAHFRPPEGYIPRRRALFLCSGAARAAACERRALCGYRRRSAIAAAENNMCVVYVCVYIYMIYDI